MFTDPEIRGGVVGRLLLSAVENEARKRGLSSLRLETGATAGFEPAWQVHERGGHSICGAFLDYPDSDYSRFYERS